MAHWVGASVEGELGVLGSLETGMGEKEDGHGFEGKLGHDQLLTDPDAGGGLRRAPPRSTRWPSPWAPATAPTSSPASRTATILAMGVIEEIHRRLPNTHLVMHGSSSVPQDLQDIINEYGGEMPQTWGVPVEEIQRGIKHGVRKINIDTDNRMAMTGAIRATAGRTKSTPANLEAGRAEGDAGSGAEPAPGRSRPPRRGDPLAVGKPSAAPDPRSGKEAAE